MNIIMLFRLALHFIMATTTTTTVFSSTAAAAPSSTYSYSSYQRGIVCHPSSPIQTPRTLQELQDIVNLARLSNQTVKAIGSLHSLTDVICTSGIPLNLSHISHFHYDPLTKYARVGAGALLSNFLEFLHAHGRALAGSPAYGGITIGGALGTGAHGSSALHATSLSDQLISLTVVDGLGQVRNVTANDNDPRYFNAFRVHLGLLGIIYEVTVATIPQYKLAVRNYLVDDQLLWNSNSNNNNSSSNRILEHARTSDNFQFWWFPTSKQVVLSVGFRVPANESGSCETHYISEMSGVQSQALAAGVEIMQETRDSVGFFLLQNYAKYGLYRKVPGRSAIYSDSEPRRWWRRNCLPEAVGYSHKMLTNVCHECFWNAGERERRSLLSVEETSFGVPLEELLPALRSLRDILNESPAEFPLNGIYVRFLTKSDGLLALSSGRDSVAIEWITVPREDKSSQPRLGLPAIQAMGQALVLSHRGRPHWGKGGLHYSSPEIIRLAHHDHSGGHLSDFVEVMNQLDPAGVFLNEFGRRLKNVSREVSIDPEYSKHCGLNELCICGRDWDCGDPNFGDNYCGEVRSGFRVCLERKDALSQTQERTARQFISYTADGGISLRAVLSKLSEYAVFGGMFDEPGSSWGYWFSSIRGGGRKSPDRSRLPFGVVLPL